MARLARVHMCGIGTDAARFSPLTLDFRDDGKKVNDAIVWLRNGGGKTCWLALFYSVFNPRAQTFLLKKAKTKEASIADFVRGDDLAYVITEWEEFTPKDNGELISTERVRIIGRVLSWRGLQQSADRSLLKNLYFSFRCTDKIGFKTLPILGIHPSPSKSFEDFRDWLRDLGNKNLNLELTIEHDMTDWERYLERVGFDPAIFRFQVMMNQREGDVDQYFKEFCSSSLKFTREFLKLAHDCPPADLLSKNILEMRSKLAKSEPLQHEQNFINAFLSELNPFRLEAETYSTFKQTLSKLQREARGMEIALQENLRILQEQLHSDGELKKVVIAARDREGDMITQFKSEIAHIEIREAEIQKSQGRAALDKAKLETEAKKLTLSIANAAVEYVELREYETQAEALTTALDLELQKNKPVLEELRKLGTLYRAALNRQKVKEEGERDEASNLIRNIKRDVAILNQTIQGKNGEKIKAESERAQIEAKLRKRNELLQSYIQNGLIQSEETPASASERLKTSLNRIEVSITELSSERTLLHDRNDKLSQEKEKTVEDKADAENQLARKVEIITRAHEGRDHLLRHRILLELTNGVLPDLENPQLQEGLKERLAASTRSILAAEVDNADDKRALNYLEGHGLLPPSRDVEALLVELKKHNIPCFSGLSYLADNVQNAEKARELIQSDPAKFSGILVNTDEILGTIKTPDLKAPIKGPVEIAVSTLDGTLVESDRVVVPPSTTGAFNRSAAAAERELIENRTQKRKQHQDEAESQAQEIQKVQRDLQEFRQEFGSGKLPVYERERDLLKEARDLLENRIAEKERERQGNSNRIRELNASIDLQQKSREPLQSDIRILTLFISDHEAAYAQNQNLAKTIGENISSFESSIQQAQQQIADFELQDERANERFVQWRIQLSATLAELSQIEHYWDDFSSEASQPLDQSRASYRAQLSVYKEVSSSQLSGQLAQINQTASSHRLKFEKTSKGLKLDEIQEFAALGNTDIRRDQSANEFQESNTSEATAKVIFNQAQANLTEIQNRNRSRAKAPEALTLETLEQVQLALRTKSEDLAAACEKKGEREREADRIDRSINHARNSIQTREHQIELLGSLDLGEAANISSEGTCGLPEDDEQIREAVKRFKSSFTDTQTNLNQVRAQLERRFKAIHSTVSQPDPKGAENAMKAKLRDITCDSLMHTAKELSESASGRGAIIAAELQSIDQDRATLATQLRIVFDSALHVLKSAERVSRLPETMKAWAKQPFLQMKLTDHSEAELDLKLRALLDEILTELEVPDGNALSFRCIEHVAGPDGLKVTILKPDVVLKAERLKVEDMGYFSGGEGVTTAILLYCTLLQLRAQNKGRVQHAKDAGSLILDNPIGKCSRTDFLRMHRQIAQQMNVQLIYMTGVNDVSAIGTFEHIIRLKNRHQNSKTGDFHVKVDDTTKTIETARIVMQTS
jgi:hypothetical protein